MGVPSLGTEWLWAPTSGCTAAQHPAPALCFWGRGMKTTVFCQRAAEEGGRQRWPGPCEAISPPVGLALARGFRYHSLQAGLGGSFGVKEPENQTCPYSSWLLHHMQNVFMKRSPPVGACLGSGVLPRREARLIASYVQPES